MESLEASLAELSRLGDVAVQELDAARGEASRQAAEAQRWRERHQELESALAGERTQLEQAQQRSGERDEELDTLRERFTSAERRWQQLETTRQRLELEALETAEQQTQMQEALAAAEQVRAQASAGMQLVLGRLEAERERAERFEQEATELRGRLRERTEQIVDLTREAALEADRARQSRQQLARVTDQLEQARAQAAAAAAAAREAEAQESAPPAPAIDPAEMERLGSRLEVRAAEAQAAEAQVTALRDANAALQLQLQELRREQAAGQGRMVALEAEWRVARWDEQILRQQLETEQKQRDRLRARAHAEDAELQQARRRLEILEQRLRFLREGATAHRVEMAEREIRLAEQQAWNQELQGEAQALEQRLSESQQARQSAADALDRALAEARRQTAEVAQLQGVLQRCEQELETLREAEQTRATEPPRTPETSAEATETGAAWTPELQVALSERESRIEDLEAVLDTLHRERDILRDREQQQARELQRLRAQLAAGEEVGASSLTEAHQQLGELEALCRQEQERLARVTTDLATLTEGSRALGAELEAERAKARELAEQRAFFESQASRVPELELEMELLRNQEGSLAAPRELTERLATLEQQITEQQALVQHAEARVSELNNLVGEKEAEILLLHAQNEGMQKQAGLLLEQVSKALMGPELSSPDHARSLLGRLHAELERMT